MAHVTPEQKKAARQIDLWSWASRHPDLFLQEGDTYRLKSNHSVCIGPHFKGYRDFAYPPTSKLGKGNAIDFFELKLNIRFLDAVPAILDGADVQALLAAPIDTFAKPPFSLPAKASNQRRLFGYLCKTRRIPAAVVQSLYDKGLIYQDLRGNVIFHSAPEDWAEVRGTLSDKPFHGITPGSDACGCWRFRMGDAPNACYICESAIDAISLYCLLGVSAWYVSLGGVGKQGTIDRIKSGKLPAVLAVDADEAGEAARSRNADIEHLTPQAPAKDWNEMLKSGMTIKQ